MCWLALGAAASFWHLPLSAQPAAPHPGVATASANTAERPSSADQGSWVREGDYRVGAIAYRIGVAAARYCPDRIPLTGLIFHHLSDYAQEDRDEAVRRYALDRGPGVIAVAPRSPAAEAGILAGDVLIAVDGAAFPPPRAVEGVEGRREWRRLSEAAERHLEERLGSGAVQIRLLREGKERDVALAPISGCPARGRLAHSSQANAFADGRYAIMTTRLLPFFRGDDELAVAIAHEIAHNILQHPARLDAEGVPKGVLRRMGRNGKRVRETEEEADRLSVRLLWASGYDVGAIIPFWRRIHGRFGSPLPFFSDHPSRRRREQVVSEAIAELSSASGSAAEASAAAGDRDTDRR